MPVIRVTISIPQPRNVKIEVMDKRGNIVYSGTFTGKTTTVETRTPTYGTSTLITVPGG